MKLDAVSMVLSREIEVLELKGQIESKAREGNDRRAAPVRAAPADEGHPDRARRRGRRSSRSCASASPRRSCPNRSRQSPIAKSIGSSA